MSVYEPEHFLTDHLASYVQDWSDGFREYFALDDPAPPEDVPFDTWQLLKAFDKLAVRLVKVAHHLTPEHGNVVGAIDILRDKLTFDVTKDRFFQQSIEIALADDLEDELDRRGRRVLDLVRLIVAVPYHRARAYLERAAACYIRGMETEAVVMCGAVLDAALQEHVDDDAIRAQIRCGKYCSLGQRIEYCDKMGLLTSDLVAVAYRVAADRNSAVYTAPGTGRDPLAVLRDVRDVLTYLIGARTCDGG